MRKDQKATADLFILLVLIYLIWFEISKNAKNSLVPSMAVAFSYLFSTYYVLIFFC